MWPELFKEEGRPSLTADAFLYMYHPQKCPENAWAFRSRCSMGSPVELTKAQTNWREWRKRVIVVAGEGWECFEEEKRDGFVPWPVLRVWGEPSDDTPPFSSSHTGPLHYLVTAHAFPYNGPRNGSRPIYPPSRHTNPLPPLSYGSNGIGGPSYGRVNYHRLFPKRKGFNSFTPPPGHQEFP